MSNQPDLVREAAAAELDALANKAASLAKRLRAEGEVPAVVVAAILVQTNRQLGRLARHEGRMQR